MYSLRAFPPFSEAYAHKRRIESLLRYTEMTFEMPEKEVHPVIAGTQKASSMIGNMNTHPRTARNSSRGIDSLVKEHRSCTIPCINGNLTDLIQKEGHPHGIEAIQDRHADKRDVHHLL